MESLRDSRSEKLIEKSVKKEEFSTEELTDFLEISNQFESLLEGIVEKILSNDEMKLEVDNLDQIARWEAVGKVSRVMTDTLSTLGSPYSIMLVAFDWFGMQEGRSIPKKKVDELLEFKVEEIDK